MISKEILQKLANQYHTSDFPNIAREYCQHLFLSELYKMQTAENLLFKGGTALRIIYGSPRFSEDLDFSLFNIEPLTAKKFIEDLFGNVLVGISRIGIQVELGAKPGATAEGYLGDATFGLHDYPPVAVVINVSTRNGRIVKGEIDTVANDFIPAYNVFHLPQEMLVEEKVFSALLQRKKARDFYDLYFIMRHRMLTPDQKKRLAEVSTKILEYMRSMDFRGELGVFLPVDQQQIISDFQNILANEFNRQLATI